MPVKTVAIDEPVLRRPLFRRSIQLWRTGAAGAACSGAEGVGAVPWSAAVAGAIAAAGAAGAVGATMVQMAKHAGLYVVATASGQGIDLVKSLGADEVIDYKTQDVTMLVKDVDLVADCAGGPSQDKLFEVIKKGGKLLSIAGLPSQELAQQYQVEARFVSSNLSAKSLENGLKLVKEGNLKGLVTKTFSLAEAAQAQDMVAKGGVNGKVVLTIG